MAKDGSGRTLRKDAAENRDRLLAAASDLFAEHGLHVTLNDIAHHAGVGVGVGLPPILQQGRGHRRSVEQQMQAVVLPVLALSADASHQAMTQARHTKTR
jgi:hypothetical protein